MIFPSMPFSCINDYFNAYAEQVAQAYASVDNSVLERAAQLLLSTIQRDGQIFSCGNGGSAAISNHLVCDHVKNVSTDTGLLPRVQSLSSCVEIITAIANDKEYSDIFLYQLSRAARPGDMLIAISSSGSSANIIRALQWAKDNGLSTIAMTGFDGGHACQIADAPLHVKAENYGVIEDVHQSLMHILAQFIRQSQMGAGLIGVVKF